MKVLGIDVGIGSCGWALVDLEESKIINGGVRCFPQPIVEKTKESLRKIRGEHRRTRWTVFRRRQRLGKLIKLYIEKGVVESRQEFLSKIKDFKTSPWDLRVKGLKEKLEPFEWAYTLYHISRHRGFQSNRKGENQKKEGKIILEALEMLKKEFEGQSEHSTYGALIANKKQKRNKKDEYIRILKRDWLRNEVEELFKRQKEMGNGLTDDAFKEKYMHAAFFQNPLGSYEHQVGKCPIYQEEKRASHSTWAFEYSRFLQKLNNLTIMSEKGKKHLTKEQKESCRELFYTHKELTYLHIKKKLDLSESEVSSFIERQYAKSKTNNKTKDTDKTKKIRYKKFSDQPLTHALIKMFKKHGDGVDYVNLLVEGKNALDDILQISSYHHGLDEIKKDIKEKIPESKKNYVELLISEDKFEYLHEVNNKFGKHSLRVLRKIIPSLEEGFRYDEACQEAGFDHYEKPEVNIETLTNITVKRSVNQTTKLVKAILKKHGKIDRIHVELARELKHSKEENEEIEKGIKNNEKRNQEIIDLAKKELGMEISSRDDILRVKFWQDQDHKCAYSGESIHATKVLSQDTELDHIIPFSRSWDDSQNNLVLCLTEANQNKSNKLPSEFMSSEKFEALKQACAGGHLQDLKGLKKRNLLMEKFDEYETRYLNRNLNDTRYIGRFLSDYLSQDNYIKSRVGGDIENLNLEKDGKKKRLVFTRNGALTSLLRHQWGLNYLKYRDSDGDKKDKKREDDRNHFVDAVVTALATEGIVNKVSRASRKLGINKDKDIGTAGSESLIEKNAMDSNYRQAIKDNLRHKIQLPEGWENLAEKVREKYQDLIISRMVPRKMSGQVHQETIRKKGVKDFFHITQKDIENIFPGEMATKVWVYLYEAGVISYQQGGKNTGGEAFKQERRGRVNKPIDKKHFKEYFTNIKSMDVEISKTQIGEIENLIKENQPKEIFKQRIYLKDYQKGGEILEKLYNPRGRHDHIRNLLEGRIKSYRGDIKKMFVEPIRYSDEQGKVHTLRKVTIDSGKQTGIEVRKGLANRGRMVRVDIFSHIKKDKKGKEKKEFHLIPVYVCEMREEKPPRKYIKAGAEQEDWPTLDENHTFITSFYPGDLVKIKVKGEKAKMYHYVSTDRSNDRITVHQNKGKNLEIRLSLKTKAESVRRFNMDMLGGIHPIIKEEVRQWPGGQST